MEVRCDKCQARYKVDDARIGPQGLTMRCGKCQNTFRVTRPSGPAATAPVQAQAPNPAAPKPAAPARPESSSTMMFAAPSTAKPVAPAAPKPPPAFSRPAPRPGPAAAAARSAAPAEEGAGRTMMFQTGNLKTTPPVTKPVPRPAAPAGSSTMVFGQSPVPAAKPPATPTARPRPAAPDGDAGATMVFGQSPIAAPKRAATPPSARAQAWAREPETNTDENEVQAGEEANSDAGAAAEVDESLPPPPLGEAERQAEPVSREGSIQAEGAGAHPAAEGTFDKAPPKGLLIGVAAGLAVIVLIGGGLVLWKKMGKHGPPPAAMETLASAASAADKDTMASLADAESKAKDALDVAGPKSHFPQALATLARIEIQWSDALNDQASFWTDKGQQAAEAGNDARKIEAESKVAELQNQAKARLKIAFDTVAPAIKADPKSAELELALADYYRAQRSNSSLNRELKKAQALKVEEPRIALVQGLAAAQDEEGAEKAIPKLKTALNANANSARIRFRLAMAYLAAKDNDNAMKELKETLRISPQHERAKMAMEQLSAATVEQK